MIPRLLDSLPGEDKLFFDAFQYAAIGMALVAPDGKWLLVNKALCDLTGYNKDELLRLTFQGITHPEDLTEDFQDIKKMFSSDLEIYQKEKRYLHKDGSIIHILLNVSLVKDDNNQPLFFISQIQDITDRKLLENELVKQATEDMLTGISNRRQFYDLAQRDISRGSRYSDPMVLLIIDIDHFKHINDTFGHSIGDEALKRMVAVCSSTLRSIDIFGRIGGEEFGLLLIKTDAGTGRQVADRLRRSVEQCILTTEKGLVKFTISIGGVAFSDSLHSLEYRLKQADNALYEAKSSGRNRTVLIDDLALEEKQDKSLRSGLVRLEWSRNYEFGNEKMDEQHQNLFNQANILIAAMMGSKENLVCRQYMESLIADVSEHFEEEEALIDSVSYPDADEHKKVHEKLLASALQMMTRHEQGNLEIAEVLDFLAVQVVSDHMLKDDREFYTFLKEMEK